MIMSAVRAFVNDDPGARPSRPTRRPASSRPPAIPAEAADPPLVGTPRGGLVVGVQGRGRPAVQASAALSPLRVTTTPGTPESDSTFLGEGSDIAAARRKTSEMGLVYLERALTICNADALSVHDNFVAECGSCIELRGWGQVSKITDNLVGAGPAGTPSTPRVTSSPEGE